MVHDSYSKKAGLPSAGAGMVIGLARASAMRDANAKIVNCMIAVFEIEK